MIPCSDPGLEATAVSLVIMEPQRLDSRYVEPRECTDPRAAAALEAAYALRSRAEPVDTVSIGAELSRRGVSIDPEWLVNVTALYPLNRESVAPRLRELAVARQMRAEAVRLVADCERSDISAALARARAIAEQRDPNAPSEDFATLPAILEGGFAQLTRQVERNITKPPLVTTGMHELDAIIGGLEWGDLTVIGGDTSVGKSSTAFMMALAQSARGHRPGIISVEDPRKRWERRVIANVAGIPIATQRTAKLARWQWDHLTATIDRVKGTQVHFAFAVGQNLDAVIEAERTLLREFGCDVIYLDYLQAVDGVQGAWSRRDEMRIILSRAKAEVNRDHEATLVALSQMRKREDEHTKPQRADLYEANDIAQKADSIVLLWKDQHGLVNATLDKAKDDATGAEWIIERDAKTGMLRPTGDGEPYRVGGWQS